MTGRRALDAELRAVVEAARKKHRVPGTAVGLLMDGRETTITSGVTSIDNPLEVNDHTLFMIGSTSKTFAATAVMALVEQGKVSLDDHVTKHLKDFRLSSKAATAALKVRHLLTHTGGWDGDVEGPGGWGDENLAKYVNSLRKQPQETPVGTVWSYNNTGFAVAGRIVEVITGRTYERAVRELVLEPAGLEETFFAPTDVLSRRFAVGHVSTPKGPVVAHAWGIDRAGAPAGGVVSTVRDQLAYARMHMGDRRGAGGKRVLKARTLRLMQSPQFPAGCFADHVGISWMIRDVNGVRTVAHGGNISNLQLSTFLMVPERGFALTVLTNSGTGAALGGAVESWVLEKYLGLKEQKPNLVDLPLDDLRAYAGRYESKLLRSDIELKGKRLSMTTGFNVKPEDFPEEDRELLRALLATKPKPVPLGLTASDRLVTLGPGGGSRGELLRDAPGGDVKWLRWGGRLLARVG